MIGLGHAYMSLKSEETETLQMLSVSMAVLTAVLIPMNLLGGVVAFFWLLFTGNFKILVAGVFLMLALPFLVSIALLPSMLVAAPMAYFLKDSTEEQGPAVYFFGLLGALYTGFVICCTVFLTYKFFLTPKNLFTASIIPLLLLSYSLSVGTFGYMASKEPDGDLTSTLAAMFAGVVGLLTGLFWFFFSGNPTPTVQALALSCLLFAPFMVCAVYLEGAKTPETYRTGLRNLRIMIGLGGFTLLVGLIVIAAEGRRGQDRYQLSRMKQAQDVRPGDYENLMNSIPPEEQQVFAFWKEIELTNKRLTKQQWSKMDRLLRAVPEPRNKSKVGMAIRLMNISAQMNKAILNFVQKCPAPEAHAEECDKPREYLTQYKNRYTEPGLGPERFEADVATLSQLKKLADSGRLSSESIQAMENGIRTKISNAEKLSTVWAKYSKGQDSP